MSDLKVSVAKKRDGVFIISPAGSIDSDTYHILQDEVDALLEPMPTAVIFDMAEVDYMSSMGITVILKAKGLIEKGGGSVLLINLQAQIAKIFDIVKAIPAQNIFSSTAELDRYLAGIQRKEIDKRRPAK